MCFVQINKDVTSIFSPSENLWRVLSPGLWRMVRSAGGSHFQGCPLSPSPAAPAKGRDPQSGEEGGATQ